MTGARKVQPNPEDTSYVRLIKAVMTQHGWNDRELANELSVGRSTVTCWRTGRRAPHPAWMGMIRALLVV